MAKTNDKLDRGTREGHGENSKAPSVRKGTYMQVGTTVELSTKAISPNQKSGSSSGGEEGGI
jgi:hypothetical protein